MKKLLMAMILGALALTSCAGGGEPAPVTKEQVPETAAQEAMKIDTYTTWKDITAYFHPETKLTEDEEKLQSQIKLFRSSDSRTDRSRGRSRTIPGVRLSMHSIRISPPIWRKRT